MSRRLLASERKERIVDLLRDGRSVRTVELAATLGVSLVTVRRDLEQLEVEALVTRVHGGARSALGRGTVIGSGVDTAVIVTDSAETARRLRDAGFAGVVRLERRRLTTLLGSSRTSA